MAIMGDIDDGAARQSQTIRLQQLSDLCEDRRAKIMGFEQMTKVHQGRGVGNGLVTKIETTEIEEQGDVVERFLAGFIGEVEAVGNAVRAQHPFQAKRWSIVTRLRVMQLDQGTFSAHGINRSIPARNFVFHVARACFCFSNPVVARVTCFIVLLPLIKLPRLAA